MARAQFSLIARSLIVGAVAFWMPILIACTLFGDDWGVLLMIVPLTLVLPLLVCFVQEQLAKPQRGSRATVANGTVLHGAVRYGCARPKGTSC